MSKSVHRTSRHHTDLQQSQSPVQPGDKPVRRDAPDERHLLDRIMNTPSLERVVPRLHPGLLQRVIQHIGLEDCGELVALATPEQLERIFDIDLWRSGQPGMDEQFDADRFGVWIEVLVESGSAVAAQKIAGMDVDLLVAGLSQHVLVYDRGAVTPYETLDGEQVAAICDAGDGLACDVGDYVIVARRADSWDAIVEVLGALDGEHPDYFHQVMCGCRKLSDSEPEVDGLHDHLLVGDQVMFNLETDRERRREKEGYATPSQARAFLQMSRQLRLDSDAMPTANPLARAYFRAVDERLAEEVHSESGFLAKGSEVPAASEDAAESDARVYSVLLEAGILDQAPRALLAGSESNAPRLVYIQTHMQFLLENDPMTYSTRSEELAYLANTLMAGCAIQTRPFSAQEASDAAVAVCNLGLQNWPSHWLPANSTTLPGSFLVDHDLVRVFQVGWVVLYNRVSMYAAEQLIGVLTHILCNDPEIQLELDALRSEMSKHWQAGTPWRARDALDVIATLDIPAWTALLALIDECPVLHAVVGALKESRTISVSAADFEFISENSQIESVRDFMKSLPELLGF